MEHRFPKPPKKPAPERSKQELLDLARKFNELERLKKQWAQADLTNYHSLFSEEIPDNKPVGKSKRLLDSKGNVRR